jgi:two-component system CheB/CheR fusion protein
VETTDGHFYFMRILPYKTAGRINGAVLNFIDTQEIKASREQMRLTREALLYADSIVNTVREPLLVLDRDLKVLSANPAFYKAFQVTPQETEGHFLFDLGNRQWNIPQLRDFLKNVATGGGPVEGYLIEHEFPKIGHRKMLLNARRVIQEEVGIDRILLAIEDFTARPHEREAS